VVQNKEVISIGAIVKAHGIKGEVSVTPLTDEPKQFSELKSVHLNVKNNRTRVEIEKVRFHQNIIILKLAHINDRNSAENLKGALIEREFSQMRKLEDNEYYIFDLMGLIVKDLQGNIFGEVVDVMDLPANDVYVVRNANEDEFLIPAIQDVIIKIDLVQKEMLIDPMDGLFD
jgi:16S rRNA processing protein RimM